MSSTPPTSLVERRLTRRSRRAGTGHGLLRVEVMHAREEHSARRRGVQFEGLALRHEAAPRDVVLERLRAVADAPVTVDTVAALAADLAVVDESLLGAEDRLIVLRATDRLSAWSQARAATALATYVGPHVGDAQHDRHMRLEVRIARSVSDTAAGNDIANARALAEHAAPVRDLWSRGEISYRHVAAVLDRTDGLDIELATMVVDAIVDRLPRTPATRVRQRVTRTIARLAPKAAAEKARAARKHDVGVSFRSLPDGLGQVTAILPVEAARAVVEHNDTAADAFLDHQRGCADCAEAIPAEIGPARAHAFLTALGLDSRGNPLPETADGAVDLDSNPGADPAVEDEDAAQDARRGSATRRGRAGRGKRPGRASRRRGELQVVIDFATLMGLAENPGLLNGQPIPSEIARELVGECGSMRRIITDPLTAHMLDYGRRVYLPEPLKVLTGARDGTCRTPCCGQPATRSQYDHVIPFPIGPSDPANGQTACKRDHDSKTHGDIVFTSHDADGSATWRTRHGQTGSTPPRPYLNDPADDHGCPF
ncbi:MAG: HNH endonuclease signature motif containing protein [Candidatus Nanopelagicales bacterium]